MKIRSQFPVAIAALLTTASLSASAARVLQKDGVSVGWPVGTQLAFELLESYPNSLPAEVAGAQISQAMQLWNEQVACKVPPLSVSGPASATPQSGDGKNTIAWIYSDWASTTNATNESPGVTDIRVGPDEQGRYRILEADVYLNAERFTWTTDVAAVGLVSSQQVQYVKEVVAHELGHALGMDHPCEYEPTGDIVDCSTGLYSGTLMFPNPRYVEPAVNADDAAGLCGLYQTLGACVENGGRCRGTVDSSSFVLPVGQGGACKKHAECESFLACLDGKCRFGQGAPGDVCEIHAQCADGACINGGCRANCTEQEPCPYANQQCDDTTSACGVKLRIFGKKCDEADDCASAQCIVESGAPSYCTKECGTDAECPSGWECSAMNEIHVCRKPQPSGDGCSMVAASQRGERSSAIVLLLAVGFLGLLIRRQQRTGEN